MIDSDYLPHAPRYCDPPGFVPPEWLVVARQAAFAHAMMRSYERTAREWARSTSRSVAAGLEMVKADQWRARRDEAVRRSRSLREMDAISAAMAPTCAQRAGGWR